MTNPDTMRRFMSDLLGLMEETWRPITKGDRNRLNVLADDLKSTYNDPMASAMVDAYIGEMERLLLWEHDRKR